MRSSKQLLTLGLALGAAGLVSCSTPKPECTVAATTTNPAGYTGVQAFAVRYVLVSGSGPCAELKGDVIGMQPYHPATPEDPQIRDFSRTSIAIRTQSLGELLWMNEDFGLAIEKDLDPNVPNEQKCIDPRLEVDAGRSCAAATDCCGFPSAECNAGTCVRHDANAIGEFAVTEPDGDELCQVQAMVESRQIFPGVQVPMDYAKSCMDDTDCANLNPDGSIPDGTCTPVDPDDPNAGNTCIGVFDIPATDLAYRWSNVQVYVTAAVTGTQFTADLEVELNGCTAQYKAVGMWPAVDCTVAYDDAGNPVGDVRLCHPEPDPKNTELPRPYGSGINPDFGPVVCDPNFAPQSTVEFYHQLGGFSPYQPADGMNPEVPPSLGSGLAAARCTLGQDTLPALEGFEKLVPAE